MGARHTTLQDQNFIAELAHETGFSTNQIQRFYGRFQALDKDKKGYLSGFDLLQLPELGVNPLAERIVLAIYRETRSDDFLELHCRPDNRHPGAERNPLMQDIRIPFTSFVRAFARFRATDVSKNTNELYATVTGKMLFLFRMFDLTNDGAITMSEVFSLIKTLSPHISDEDVEKFSAEFFIEASADGLVKETITLQDFCAGNDRTRLVKDLYFRFSK
jgi:calcineurin B family protein 2